MILKSHFMKNLASWQYKMVLVKQSQMKRGMAHQAEHLSFLVGKFLQKIFRRLPAIFSKSYLPVTIPLESAVFTSVRETGIIRASAGGREKNDMEIKR